MSNYTPVNFHFNVEWGGTRTAFNEVSGLTIEHDIIEHRDGNSPAYHKSKMPGLEKYQHIILKRGILQGDNEFYEWMNTVQLNKVEKRDLVISLLNEEHSPVMKWKVKDAWPVKLSGPILNSESSEVSIEILELAHEGIELETE